jgi:hypothetical protein
MFFRLDNTGGLKAASATKAPATGGLCAARDGSRIGKSFARPPRAVCARRELGSENGNRSRDGDQSKSLADASGNLVQGRKNTEPLNLKSI